VRELAKQQLYKALIAIEFAIQAFYVGVNPDNGHDTLPPLQRQALEKLQKEKRDCEEIIQLLTKADQLEEDTSDLAGVGSGDIE
jgi:hypothetical protein